LTTAVEANVDGLVGPTHNYAGLSVGNLASQSNLGAVSNPRAAALQGLAKMKHLADLGVPQFVLPPHPRPHLGLLRRLGFTGSDVHVNEAAWKAAPALAGAAWSASAMWAANAATVTPSADSADGRVHFTPANLLTTLHRSLEGPVTAASLRRLFPDPGHFVVHDPLPAQPHFSDEGAANHVRLCAEQGGPGVNMMVWGRDAYAPWEGRYPARQTREAFEAVVRRHGTARAIFPRQSAAAIEAGAFHNDVVCVGTGRCLLYHQHAFDDTEAMQAAVRAAAGDVFDPVFVEIAEADLALSEAVSSYLFNAQLLQLPGRDRLTLLAPMETHDCTAARAVADRLAASNGPTGEVVYMDLRESMRNGGGPACLRLRVVLTREELAAAAPEYRLDDALYVRLHDWICAHYRDRLAPQDLAGAEMIDESRTALEALDTILASRRSGGVA
jgi:succinylarginine dihydrolase